MSTLCCRGNHRVFIAEFWCDFVSPVAGEHNEEYNGVEKGETRERAEDFPIFFLVHSFTVYRARLAVIVPR